jgi:hypothetical protein
MTPWKKKNLTPMAKAKAAGMSAHKPQPGLLVTKKLNQAIADCKAKVESISKECRMKNQKFRSVDIDASYRVTRLRSTLDLSDVEISNSIWKMTKIDASTDFSLTLKT